MKQILDFIKQLLGLMQKEQAIIPDVSIPPQAPPIPHPTPIIHPKIAIWAKSIQENEGWRPGSRSYVNNNPGNLKWGDYEKELGAINKDAGNFCIFKDYNSGFNALCQFLTDAASNRLLPYHNVSLITFTHTYAQPPNSNYVNGVAEALKVAPTILIKELL